MRRTLRGKRCLITGASSGIGRAIAIELAAAGARLLLTSNQTDRLREVADGLSASSPDIVQVPGDITSPDDRAAIFAAARERFGGLDILINNAGVGGNTPFLDEDPAVLRRMMEVNFFAVAECCRAGIPLLVAGEQPIIVNVSSMFGRRGVSNWSSYCASKFAVCGFSEALRSELAAMSIDLMVVLPGVTRTEFGNSLLSGAPLDLTTGLDPARLAKIVLSGIERNRRELKIGRDSKRLILLNRIFPNRLFPTRLERRMVPFARHMQGATANASVSLTAASNGDQTVVNLRSMRGRRIEFIRTVERILPHLIFNAAICPFILYRSIKDSRAAYSALQARGREPLALYRSTTQSAMLRASYRLIAMNLLRHWPDRLAQPRWLRRCKIFGEEIFQTALSTGRPLILTTVHYSGLPIMYHWLRSRGLPVAAMTTDTHRDAYRRHYDLLADVANHLSQVPSLFGTTIEDLLDARDFLSTPGNALLIAIDGTAGSHPVTIELDDMTVHVHLGAFSIATITNAIMLPCLLRANSGMSSEIHFREPVPDDLLTHRRTYKSAAEHVLNQIMPPVRECPEQGFYAGLGVGPIESKNVPNCDGLTRKVTLS